MFWHGRNFGVRLSNYVKWYLWKSVIFAATLLYFNNQTGFSGWTFFSDLFYACYKSNLFAITILVYLTIDQDVDMRLTNNENKLTFKLSEYYAHCRDNVLNKTMITYLYWLVWALVSALAIYFIPQYSYYLNYAPNGKTEQMHASGYASIFIMVTAHQI